MTERSGFLALLMERISILQTVRGIARVAITGVDGAGKTHLANELARLMRDVAVIRISIDDFHNPCSVRYARGRYSPEGYYRDAFDLDRFKSLALDPLSPGGSLRYRIAAFDYRADAPVSPPEQIARPPAALIVDGIFLLRPELNDYWDLSVFLDVPFETAFQRMALRDGSPLGSFVEGNSRYREGQLLHFAESRPHERAHLLIDYADFDRPKIVRSTLTRA